MGCAIAALAASNDTFLIRNADVYPVTGAEMKGVSVLIQDGKIADIGVNLVAPKGMRVIEAKGLRVYPGMIDSGTELGLSEILLVRETVDTDELGEFMPQLRALVAVNPGSEHFGVVRVNGITSAMTFPSSGGRGGERQIISGQAALIHTDGWTWEEMAVERTAAMHLLFPDIAAGGSYTQARRTYEQQVAKLNDFFDQAHQYQKERAAHAPGFKTNLKMEAMLPVLEGKVPVAVSASRANAIHDAVAFADKQNIKIVILQPRELEKAAPELKAKNIPVILGRVMALPEAEDDPYDQAFTLPAQAYKAGVKFAFGTFNCEPTPNCPGQTSTNEFVRNLPYQAATAVAFGLPYDEALKALTINPAQIWGVGNQLGSVEKGKWADLMIATGDPLEIQTEIKHLYIKGKEVELTNKQTRLYEKYMAR
jgi:imidazolonepropionase-like amidohydrolase